MTTDNLVPPIKIYIDESVLSLAKYHVLSNKNVETGGVLVGLHKTNDGIDAKSYDVTIVDAIAAIKAINSQTSVSFTAESWKEIWIEMDNRYPNMEREIVGWYHSHPNFGIFLSTADTHFHKTFYSNKWHVALVIDPIKDSWGFFGWAGDNIVQIPDIQIVVNPNNQT